MKIDKRLYDIIGAAIERHPNFLNSFHNENWANAVYELYHSDTDGEGKELVVNMILGEKPSIIYTKEFAQAFWFSDEDEHIGVTYRFYKVKKEVHIDHQRLTIWKYHQVKLILADDPLEYLGRFILHNRDIKEWR